jgi:hypothetical protein
MLTEVEKAYFAGLFDGEGCVSVRYDPVKKEKYNKQIINIAEYKSKVGVKSLDT